jgi:hypothetical protein
MIQKKSDFFLAKVHTYTVAYPQNSGYNTNHMYEKDIGCNYDIAVQYRRKEPENPGMFRYLFQVKNKVTGV